MQRLAEAVERQRLDVIFEVRASPGSGPTSRTRPAGSAPSSSARSAAAGIRARSAPCPTGGGEGVERQRVADLVDAGAAADGPAGSRRRRGSVVHDGDAELAQPLRLADAGELSRTAASRSRLRRGSPRRAPARSASLPSTRASTPTARRFSISTRFAWRAGHDAQVGAVAHGLQERLGGVPAHAAALGHVEERDAVIVAAVEVA